MSDVSGTRIPSLGPRGEGWVVIQFVLLGLIALVPFVLPRGWPEPLGLVLGLVGMFLGLVGLGIAAKGLLDLRDALTPLPHPRDGSELVETGVYGRVRHPIYGGIVLGATGWSLVTGSVTALVLSGVLLVFFRLKSGREEAWLRRRYPGYEAYARRARRMIPFLY
jgi:protein-S-isoprenylcysteine O-methyltransferase Ste14